MPFVTKHESNPPKVHWGEPKKSLRAVVTDVNGAYGVFVLEQPAGKVTFKMENKTTKYRWSHDIFLPWRYFAIRVRWDGRVDLSNCGAVWFSNRKIEALEDSDLRSPFFPNVFESGPICSGYVSIFDRTPLRAAWKAVRKFYEIPGNQWLSSSPVPHEIKSAETRLVACSNHYLHGNVFPDYICRWASLSLEDVLKIHWGRPYLSIKEAAARTLGKGNYQPVHELSDESVKSVLAEIEAERRA